MCETSSAAARAPKFVLVHARTLVTSLAIIMAVLVLSLAQWPQPVMADTPTSPNIAPATKSDTDFTNTTLATKSNSLTSPNSVPRTNSDA